MIQLLTRLVGGAAQSAIIMARELRRAGFDSLLVSGPETEGNLRIPDDVPHTIVPTLRRTIDPSADLRSLRHLRRLISASHPDVLIAHMSKVGTLGRLAAGRAARPVVVRMFHGHVLEGYFSSVSTYVFRLIERRLATRTDAFVTVSAAVRDELLAMRVGERSKWHVIPIGIDVDAISSNLPSRTEARRRLGLPEQATIVGMVGRLAPEKDHATFFRSIKRVSIHRPEAIFVLAGEGPLSRQLRAEAQLIPGEPVRFLGWVSDLPALYGALDVLALTSRKEGTPRVLMEAGAAGLPVVATGVGGVEEVVEHEVTGLIVPQGQDAAVADALLRLLGDKPACEEMGRRAQQRVKDRFSSQRFGGEIAGLLSRLLDEGQGGAG